jgi:RsiW-degrading membrane proteinase PrsW (M82 family)
VNRHRFARPPVAAAAAILLMFAFGLVTMLLVALETGAAGFAVGLLLALLPLPVYLSLALWIDRYEKEPIAMLALSFLWGASVAVFFSYLLNSSIGLTLFLLVGEQAGQMWGAVLTAPMIEESAKGAALFLLCFWRWDEFDNVTDGIVYAAIVGLGFATTENVLYYGKAFEEGIAGSVTAFLLRGVLAPFSHPLFTAMIGVGLGLAREARSRAAVLAPAAGFLLAVGLHAAWNLSAALGAAFFFTYLFVMVPFFFGLLALVAWSAQRERAILSSHLQPYAAAGELTREEIERVVSPRARFRARLGAARTEGLAGWRRAGAFQRAAGELAFHRWRRSRGLGRGVDLDEALERATLARLRAARTREHPSG